MVPPVTYQSFKIWYKQWILKLISYSCQVILSKLFLLKPFVQSPWYASITRTISTNCPLDNISSFMPWEDQQSQTNWLNGIYQLISEINLVCKRLLFMFLSELKQTRTLAFSNWPLLRYRIQNVKHFYCSKLTLWQI